MYDGTCLRKTDWRSSGGYVDDLVVKNKFAQQHPQHLAEVFDLLRHQIKLNPAKCTFGITCGHFLGYLWTLLGLPSHTTRNRG